MKDFKIGDLFIYQESGVWKVVDFAYNGNGIAGIRVADNNFKKVNGKKKRSFLDYQARKLTIESECAIIDKQIEELKQKKNNLLNGDFFNV